MSDTGAGQAAGRRKAGRARRLALGGLVLAVLCALLALGTWQVQRLFWKLDLIERVETRVHAPAAPLAGPADWADFSLADWEYRHVRLVGTFLHEDETLTQAVTGQGPGFWVLTPLRLSESGATVLVNRGFVPNDRRDPATRREGEVPGTVAVEGLVRGTEPGGGFLRTNEPTGNRWYSRDVAAIAEARSLPDAAPFFVDADAAPNPGGLPVGGLTVVSFRNHHLVYAITWYTLAALLAGATLRIWYVEKKRRGEG